jgi:2-methylcitrate dehydratase PrpD
VSELAPLAAFLASLEAAALPSAVREAARLHVLDTLAALVAGRGSDLARALAPLAGQEVEGEALVGAALAHRHEIDDIFDAALLCIGGLVVPTALALGRARGASGADVLAAVVAGYEAMGRLGLALGAARLLARGWWPSAVCGAVGGAAAASRLLELPAEATASALGLAALHSGGLAGGADSLLGRNLLYGSVARAGLLAAQAAAAGITGPAAPLGAPRGLGAAYGVAPDLSQLVDGLGERFVVAQTSLKPYACARQLHAAVEAALELRRGLPPEAIEQVLVEVPADAAFVDRPAGAALPAAPAGSAQWVLALALARGRLLPDDLAPEALASVRSLAQRVTVHVAAPGARPALSAALTVRAAGQTRQREVRVPKGGPARPLTLQEAVDKARALVEPHLEADTARFIDLALGLDALPTVEALAALAAPRQ